MKFTRSAKKSINPFEPIQTSSMDKMRKSMGDVEDFQKGKKAMAEVTQPQRYTHLNW